MQSIIYYFMAVIGSVVLIPISFASDSNEYEDEVIASGTFSSCDYHIGTVSSSAEVSSLTLGPTFPALSSVENLQKHLATLGNAAAFDEYFANIPLISRSNIFSQNEQRVPSLSLTENLDAQAIVIEDQQSAAILAKLKPLEVEEEFKKGESYSKEKDSTPHYNQAFDAYLKAADYNHILAQARIQEIYQARQGIFVTPAEAFIKLADETSISFMRLVIMGWMYRDGLGVEKDIKQAFIILHLVAQQGFASALYSLADFYNEGWGVEKNQTEAFYLYQAAAQQSLPQAQLMLGEIYYKGQGIKRNFEKAAHWFHSAALQGDALAQYNLSFMYLEGQGINKNTDAAITWLKAASSRGLAKASYNLGGLYYKSHNIKKAFRYYKEAAEKDYGPAQYNLALMYDKGEGIAQNKTEAFRWYKAAARSGHAKAHYNLGIFYYTGYMYGKDPLKAFACFRTAANKGDVRALYNLGVMYEHGEGVAQNKTLALQFYQKAAEQGDDNAKKALLRLKPDAWIEAALS